MTSDATAVLVMTDYAMLSAFVSVGFVYDSTNNKQYISLCLRDQFQYAMPDRDIHIAVEDVPAVIDALQDQLNAFKRAQK